MVHQKYHTGEPVLHSGSKTKDLAVKGILDRCGNTLIKNKIKIVLTYKKTLCFGVKANQPKQTVSKQTEKKEKRKKWKSPKFSVKNSKICSLSNCFGWSSVCFGVIETSKLSVSV